ncbi:MAG TPA: hypothetical protein VME63_01445 [Dyella sp.]|uniref:hypothetical protein n=1 Tax=Dyella sp. TaxID=1869338 RepID=UPI002B7B837D|nr:hypothetical protein [Dyella sp.]HTV84040.1 hypothetical protein [Dyella sp.]
MKTSWLSGVVLLSLLPALAMAQSAFDGTWKIDLGKVHMPAKPDVLVLEKGIYQCKTCTPAISVKADGNDHSVTGHPYYDSVAIKVVDAHTIQETDKKHGKVVATSTIAVSSDGKTAEVEFTDSSDTDAAPVSGKATLSRVAPGPVGAHAISGSWRNTKMQSLSDNGLVMTFKVDGDHLNMSTPTGQSYNAKMDGTETPYQGDPGITSVTVTKTGANSFTETDKRDGKPISIAEVKVAPDGHTMNVVVHDKLRGTTTTFVADKQ